MENILLQLSIDSILNQANAAFGGLLDETMGMISRMTETMASMF